MVNAIYTILKHHKAIPKGLLLESAILSKSIHKFNIIDPCFRRDDSVNVLLLRQLERPGRNIIFREHIRNLPIRQPAIS
jgi:hypothetical protein